MLCNWGVSLLASRVFTLRETMATMSTMRKKDPVLRIAETSVAHMGHRGPVFGKIYMCSIRVYEFAVGENENTKCAQFCVEAMIVCWVVREHEHEHVFLPSTRPSSIRTLTTSSLTTSSLLFKGLSVQSC